MEIILEILGASWKVFQEAAIYLLVGFLVSGLIRVYISPDSVTRYFHQGRFKSVLYATLVGIPLPL